MPECKRTGYMNAKKIKLSLRAWRPFKNTQELLIDTQLSSPLCHSFILQLFIIRNVI